MKTLVLINPAAGGAHARSLPQVLDYLRALGVEFDRHEAHSPAELRQAARQAVAEQYELVVTAGGDGTSHQALQALAGSETALGLLPFGNGNDFARNLGIPLDPILACRLIARCKTRRIDLARVRGPVEEYYAGVGGFGLDAAVNRLANERRIPLRGTALYIASAIAVLARFRPIQIELASDGGNFSGEAMVAVVVNGGGYGGGLKIAPLARMDDGQLDVVVIERTSRLDLLELVPQLLRGTAMHAPILRSWRASTVELRQPVGEDFFCDGEYLARLPFRVEIAPAALRVIAP